MSPTLRLISSLLKLILPVIVLFALVLFGVSVYLIREAARPETRTYAVTPQEYSLLSERGKQITDETWQNGEGPNSRGWLLRGKRGAPAVVFLHNFGADRSHLLNVAVRLNEATDFTVLIPDLRGHGPNPLSEYSSFGGCEADDLRSALRFLRGLKTPEGSPQIGPKIGVYGTGIGALAALGGVVGEEDVTSLVLDSVPADSATVLRLVAERRFPAPGASFFLADLGARVFYSNGCFRRVPACEMAKSLKGVKVGLLSGSDSPVLNASTKEVAACFPAGIEPKLQLDLPVSGYSIVKASVKDAGDYSLKVNEFFKESLGK